MSRAAILLCGVAATATARAADDDAAGLYGMLDSDFLLATAAGGGLHAGSTVGADAMLEARLRYVGSAGIVVAATARSSDAGLAPGGLVGVELMPLFLGTFFEDRFSGEAFWDLVLYGLGVTAAIGIDDRGACLLGGLGTDWPLVRERSSGLFLRTEGRARFAREAFRGSDEDVGEVAILALLQLRTPLDFGLVR